MTKEPVAVLGTGQTHHRAKRQDVSMAGLCREAIDRAMADAAGRLGRHRRRRDRQGAGLLRGRHDARAVPGRRARRGRASRCCGCTPRARSAARPRSSRASLVKAGVHKRVLAVAWEKQSESNAMWAPVHPDPVQHAGERRRRRLLRAARALLHPALGRPDHIGAMVAVKDRLNGAKNPFAHLHQPDITLESVQASQMLWDPIRYDETCPSSDGACAVVLGDEAAGRRGRRDRPGSTRRRCAPSRRRSPAATRSARRPAGRRRRAVEAGRDHRPARARSTSPRSTCRSPGSSRCGWRTSASPPRARAGSSPRPARRRSAAGCPSTRPAACCLQPDRRVGHAPLRRGRDAGDGPGRRPPGGRRPQGARPRLRRRLAVLLDVGRRRGQAVKFHPGRRDEPARRGRRIWPGPPARAARRRVAAQGRHLSRCSSALRLVQYYFGTRDDLLLGALEILNADAGESIRRSSAPRRSAASRRWPCRTRSSTPRRCRPSTRTPRLFVRSLSTPCVADGSRMWDADTPWGDPLIIAGSRPAGGRAAAVERRRPQTSIILASAPGDGHCHLHDPLLHQAGARWRSRNPPVGPPAAAGSGTNSTVSLANVAT